MTAAAPSSGPRAALLVAGKAAAVVLLLLLVFTARVVLQSRAELRAAEAQLAAGEAEGAVETLGRAARLHAPGNPFSSAALDRLESIAVAADERGARGEALAAWREVRSALRATRALVPRDPDRARRADARIALLSAALEPPSVQPGADEATRAAWHAARLAEDHAPSVGWSLLALAGLALWVGAAFALLSRGLDERLRLVRGPALLYAALVGLGFALFLVGLARA